MVITFAATSADRRSDTSGMLGGMHADVKKFVTIFSPFAVQKVQKLNFWGA
jgi:hypothetical protein